MNRESVLNSEVGLFLRPISMYAIDLGAYAPVPNSQMVLKRQVSLYFGVWETKKYIYNRREVAKFQVLQIISLKISPQVWLPISDEGEGGGWGWWWLKSDTCVKLLFIYLFIY